MAEQMTVPEWKAWYRNLTPEARDKYDAWLLEKFGDVVGQRHIDAARE